MPIRWGTTSRTLVSSPLFSPLMTEQISMSMANSFENERLHFSKIYFILSKRLEASTDGTSTEARW